MYIPYVTVGKHNLAGLRPAARYEAKVATRNEHGWSRVSPTFNFATFGAGNKDSLVDTVTFCSWQLST